MVKYVLLVLCKDLILLYLLVGEYFECILWTTPVIAALLEYGVGVNALLVFVGINILMLDDLN